MRHRLNTIQKHLPWLFLLLGIDGAAALLLWLADVEAFRALILVMTLGTLLLFAALAVMLIYMEEKRRQAFLDFLEHPDEHNEEVLIRLLRGTEGEMVRLLGDTLRGKERDYERLAVQVVDYEEYVEAWAHETKTPISLLTLLLDNRRDELPDSVGRKLDFVRNRMQESVSQMLYYARLKGTGKDYLFEFISLSECIEEVMSDYRILMEEKQVQVDNHVPDIKVYSDRRGLIFLLSQIICNSVKYCDEGKSPRLELDLREDAQHYVLCIKDNGIGVRSSDLPYIFEKGFTGNSGEARTRATGMGLYLAKAIADNLNVELDACSEWGEGFEMSIYFPIVSECLSV